MMKFRVRGSDGNQGLDDRQRSVRNGSIAAGDHASLFEVFSRAMNGIIAAPTSAITAAT